MTTFSLAVNTGFAVNRYSEHEEWVRIVSEDLKIKNVQMTADMLNASLPISLLNKHIKEINRALNHYHVSITSTFTGAFTRVNHLAHPDRDVQLYWIDWFKRFVDITVDLGATSMGSHFGIFTAKDNNDPQRREQRRKQNIENWHVIGDYANKRGLRFISWEPMSIPREQGETLEECRRLQQDVNRAAPLPFKICLDVDHGDLVSPNPDDTNPYAWLEHFASESPLIHLKQSLRDKGGHYPFTPEYNANGKIEADKVLKTLNQHSKENDHIELILEHSFRERRPVDDKVIELMTLSAQYWQRYII